jgi:hypothetical protein
MVEDRSLGRVAQMGAEEAMGHAMRWGARSQASVCHSPGHCNRQVYTVDAARNVIRGKIQRNDLITFSGSSLSQVKRSISRPGGIA